LKSLKKNKNNEIISNRTVTLDEWRNVWRGAKLFGTKPIQPMPTTSLIQARCLLIEDDN
jgi:hypothetical protein